MSKYYPPQYKSRNFNCPFCHVYAYQNWYPVALYDPINKEFKDELVIPRGLSVKLEEVNISVCNHCNEFIIWLSEDIIYPHVCTTPPANSDLPDTVKELYDEAASIANQSPRAASALLRLAIEKLLEHLGEKGNFNDGIKNLVKKGLDTRVQQALDIVRVTGNHAVHAGVIDFDDTTNVQTLFELINVIADTLITQSNRIKEMYDNLPEKDLKAIEKRDETTP